MKPTIQPKPARPAPRTDKQPAAVPKVVAKALTETPHARLGPSTLKAREICPSYQTDSTESAASARGTMLHGLLEKYGWKAATSKEAQALDATDLSALEKICGYTKELEIWKGLVIHRELELDLRSLDIRGCDKGTGDLVILAGRVGHLVDYKMGWWEVDEAETNLQIQVYVAGVFAMFPQLDEVTAHILQPARDEVSTHTFGRSRDLTRIVLRARTVVDRVLDAEPEFNPVPDNCLWCAGKAKCKALHGFALKIATGTLSFPAGDLRVEGFNDIKHAGQVYDLADILEKWAKDMRYKITQLALDGSEIPGHEIKEVAGRRKVIDTVGAYEILRDSFEITLNEFLTAVEPSITAIEKIVGSKAPKGEKGKRQQEASQALVAEGLVVSSNPSSYLVRIKTKAD